ncbi:MAG: winged helix-turn-helix transcriptional regulator [Halococcoides sp.]
MSGDTPDESAGEESNGCSLESSADRAIEEFDQRVVDLLSWILETETRARIYIYLRQHQAATSQEIADGTGLYPSTVREAAAELTSEDVLTRQKRESDGAGNNPYEYDAIPPSELVGSFVGDIQKQLNALCDLDAELGLEESSDDEGVTITVEGPNEA